MVHEAVSANLGSSDRFLPQTDMAWRDKRNEKAPEGA
ncbi:hypothetical protein FuraDRAFT_3471 [Pseudogulbenkiania ferrooxidans 2002]|uniref:Uncharacterized protein n=1 Tax=Pseudogulbenkiania ferrooxidans 2002 TaxID=279714 RepID=B9Z7Y5_9NEIS|nr:hypothetical protein FuraDRAFT_3471 [Pseudogulbenkiania ferrooxidans 2002]